jgi:ribosomal protein S18 acetylase RimI-like enzyme
MISPLSIRLRPASSADLPFLDTLRTLTLRVEAGAHHPWNAETQRKLLLLHFDCARIIMCAGRDIGLIKVVRNAQEIHVHQLLLLPQYQRHGIASTLLSTLQHESLVKGIPITLYVRRNLRVTTLYRQLGFRLAHEDSDLLHYRWAPEVLDAVAKHPATRSSP